jgi:hypothetical protein
MFRRVELPIYSKSGSWLDLPTVIIMPAYFLGAFDIFVDLVVPELQRRGLFRRDYSGLTLRDHLGLETQATKRIAV